MPCAPYWFRHSPADGPGRKESAQFLADLLRLDEPTRCGLFLVAQLGSDVFLDFADDHGPAHPQQYAFLASETEFDQIFGRIGARHLPYWADPGKQQPGEHNTHDGAGACTRKTQRPLPEDHYLPARELI